MAKIILMSGEKPLREIPLSKARMMIGRRPHNDIVIDDLAISGEHAVIVLTDQDAFLEDLNSTNGTKVNGQPVKKHYLQHADCIELASYRLHYILGHADSLNSPAVGPCARLRVLSGAKTGREIVINKAITTIGTPDSHGVILWRADGYYLAHVEGSQHPEINGAKVGSEPCKLKNGDMIDMSGDRVEFLVI
ncbi:FHA domain-containing protein [Noviherbaspirillum sp. ST9]|uniref:FHA domain-containing protein n=1 Tax=Noviherbaspirillum sp. ST9 TaxID=3401606 RepID=UPI003B58B299